MSPDFRSGFQRKRGEKRLDDPLGEVALALNEWASVQEKGSTLWLLLLSQLVFLAFPSPFFRSGTFVFLSR